MYSNKIGKILLHTVTEWLRSVLIIIASQKDSALILSAKSVISRASHKQTLYTQAFRQQQLREESAGIVYHQKVYK